MKMPDGHHISRPWRIHEIAYDFELEDVWALPTPGGPDDFTVLLSWFSDGSTPEGRSPLLVRLLWAIRWRAGEWFGWDDPGEGLGARVPSLRDRLPADLRDGPAGPDLPNAPFSPLYLTDNEFAAEIANRTVHGILHVGWVPDEARGGYRGQLAVLVKPNGLTGRAYLAFIKPFRYLLVWPALLRRVEHEWRAARPAPTA